MFTTRFSHAALLKKKVISSSTRSFNASALLTQKKTSNEESIDASLAKAASESQLSLSSSELIYRPELWKGLPSSVVVQLYRARVIALGKNYKRSDVELKSILSNAANPLEAQTLYNIYNSTEADIYKADSETDYDNYVTEGEYMEDPLEPYGFDEYPSGAQDIVRDFRDLMEFNRKAAFELPQLAQYRKPYNPVSKKDAPIIYKYTRFIGESHPGERKVVLQLKLKDLQLNENAQHKFKLLSGSRYDHKTDIFLMSSDRYLEPAQNASFLSDVLSDLIKESNNKPEEYADIPLDKRFTNSKYAKKQRKNKNFIPFPKEWERPHQADKRTIRLTNVVDAAGNV
ncbi:37S ribosomal protein S24, mitochondrial [Pichia californica]|uniref:37S ribosomal protein S24, mitochondrial n=1 Tax=Pichia californica TaxID=460514 RepID=A0A9P7BI52_9ASCO|nr:37S ribosomal protein S24, mitochondrial [[Candida] californica]KAG0690363.1 37S ribosomal protein S24, mitochondrial [[Candida] californica]